MVAGLNDRAGVDGGIRLMSALKTKAPWRIRYPGAAAGTESQRRLFGKPYTMTLAARLALQVARPWCLSAGSVRGARLCPELLAALQGLDALSKTDLLAAVTLINQSIETLVRRQPGPLPQGYAVTKPRQSRCEQG
jgi:hypothetical protein